MTDQTSPATYLVVTNVGQDNLLVLVEGGDCGDAVCEHCGAEVGTYVVGAEDETWVMAECLPCLVKVAEHLRPATTKEVAYGGALPADQR